MFDLPGDAFPADGESLRDALDVSVRRRVVMPAGHESVMVEIDRWPKGQWLVVNLTGGRIDVPTDPAEMRRRARDELKPPAIARDRRPGPSFDVFEVRGAPVHVGPMACRVTADGTNVRFDFGRDADGRPVMTPAEGRGRVRASVPKAQLIEFVRAQARDAAAEKGVRLDEVQVDVAAPDPRTVTITGTMRGVKKIGFIKAPFAIDFHGRVEVDDALVGHVRQLELHGHGMVMDALLGLLRPKLEQVRGEPIPIRDVIGAFVPAALGLSNLAIAVGEDVSLTAEFGGAEPMGGRP